MTKHIRVSIMILVLLGILGLAQNSIAWAQPSAGPGSAVQDVSSAAQPYLDSDNKGGTVKPPPDKAKICKAGNVSLGGVSVVRVIRLEPDYCLSATLRKPSKGTGSTPAGRILANITDIQFFYQDQSIGTLPESGGVVEVCYALPPGAQAQLYFRGFGAEEWNPLITTYTKNRVCAPAQVSGSYALIGN